MTKEKTCSICGNDIDKINKWKSSSVKVHNFLTGEDLTYYICDRCFNKILKPKLKH